jgi:hypothetical protein
MYGATSQNHLTLKTTPQLIPAKSLVRSASLFRVEDDYAGTFANSFALLNALDAAGCRHGGSAEEILARPAFTVGTTKQTGAFCGVGGRTPAFRPIPAPLATFLRALNN